MIKFSSLKLCILFAFVVAFALLACTPQQKEIAKSAIDEATAACEGETASVVVQRDKAGAIIKTACAYEEEIAPFLEAVISARKAGTKAKPVASSSK